MSSIGSGPSDAQVRQGNESAMLLRAQTQLAGEVKKSANQAVRPEEDLVTLQGRQRQKPDGKDQLSSASTSQSGGQAPPQGPPSNGSAPPSNGSTPPSNQEAVFPEAHAAQLEADASSNTNRSKERDMWRTLWADWMERQMKWLEDLENFRQSVYVMWQEVAVSRWAQSGRHAEAVRSLL
jgi:hypothetical protein